MPFTDQIFVGVSGLLALAIIWVFITRFEKSKESFNIYYILGFALLLSCSVLILIYQWGILDSTFVTFIATFIPMSISLGIVNQYFKKLMIAQIVFTIIGGATILLVQMLLVSWWRYAICTIAIITLLDLTILPFIASRQNKSRKGTWWVGVGGILALAFLGLMYSYSTGLQMPYLTIPVIQAILAPLYSLASIALFWGFMQDEEEPEESLIKKEPLI